MSTRTDFPVLDFSRYKTDFDAFARDIFMASEEWGFFILTNHNIPNVDRMYELSTQFFDLPKDQKAEKTLDATMTGYDGKNLTAFAASEGVAFGMPAGRLFDKPNLPAWWTRPRLQEVEDFKASCYDISLNIMSCLAVQLGLERSFFDATHQHKDPGNPLKLIKYPRFEKQPDGIPRLSEHTDWGSITFVFTETPGLEMRDPEDQWTAVPTIPGGVVVNIADSMSLRTNKKLKSAFHRIRWDTVGVDKERLSIAYFVHPNNDAVLSDVTTDADPKEAKETAITYRDYLKIRLGLTFGSAREDGDAGVDFDTVDNATYERVKNLGIANYGAIESIQPEVST
ncbi:Clavaminate synthase-like protein [Aspergillus steynii IBT 23096]|uniref:Clavaminate synthase-like protein n=1 Tax=Aspergillus steynii IBT 23096 TaxID=1392250 RepID=A0A2I2GKI6_9EURO|nr:Clavaminate synthase-like protein [Aspergillus steynii IBT 23096]PLB53359.1 Clavaminate synthase-like protein [Aspergillus steynii IBT 23096]